MNPISSLQASQDSYNPEKELTRVLAIFLSLFLLSLACKMAIRWKIAYFPQSHLNLAAKKTASLANEKFTSKKVKLAHALGIQSRELKIYRKRGRENSEIFLMRKNLTEIPSLIDHYKKLDAIWLSNNRLTSLPDTIGNLSFLRKLYLDNNELYTLPKSLSNLSRLKILQLDNNFLDTIPDSLFRLPSFCRIYIKNNPISRNERIEVRTRMSAPGYEGPEFILPIDCVEKIS